MIALRSFVSGRSGALYSRSRLSPRSEYWGDYELRFHGFSVGKRASGPHNNGLFHHHPLRHLDDHYDDRDSSYAVNRGAPYNAGPLQNKDSRKSEIYSHIPENSVWRCVFSLFHLH